MSEASTIHIGGRPLGRVRHLCAFFQNKDDEHRTLLDFIKEGMAHNDRAFHIVDANHQENHRSWLNREGIHVDQAERSDKLRVACWEDAYLKDGYFDQHRQIRLLESILQEGREKGFPATRLIANMEWALEEKAGVADIVEYESRLNYMLPNYSDPVICTYDLSRFNAGVAIDILRTHPVVILGGVLQDNPLYVHPDAFLKELADRRSRCATA